MKMNDNLKGMLFTAGAMVVGILGATLIQTKLLDKMMGGGASADSTIDED